MIEVKYNLDIEIQEGEEFRFLNESRYMIYPYRYMVSNKGRIVDLSTGKFISITGQDDNPRVYLVNSANNRRSSFSLKHIISDVFNEDENDGKPKNPSTLSEKEIDEIRDMFINQNITIHQIASKLEVTEYTVRSVLGKQYDKFKSCCIARGGDYELSIKFMEALDAIPKEEYRKNSVTNIIKKTAESLGILFDRNVYCKAYGYITGRTTYLIINRESSTTSRRRRRPKRVEMEGPQRVRGRGEDIV